MKNKDCARAFASGLTLRGKSNRESFDGSHFYSYNALIAMKLSPTIAWVSSGKWSVTTSRHQREVESALAFYGYHLIKSEKPPTEKPQDALAKYRKGQQEAEEAYRAAQEEKASRKAGFKNVALYRRHRALAEKANVEGGT